MSGIISGIGKIFKAVVIKPIQKVFHVIKDVAVTLWHIPIIRYAALAVAAYFTAGAALGWFGAAGAAGGTAAAAGTAASTIGIMAAPTVASTAAAASVGTFGIGAATIGATSFAGFTGAAVGAAGTFSGLSEAAVASSTAAASVGSAAPLSLAANVSADAGGAVQMGGYSLATAGQGVGASTVGGLNVTNLGAVSVTAPDTAAAGSSGSGLLGTTGAAAGFTPLSSNPNMASNAPSADPNVPQSWGQRMMGDIKSGAQNAWDHVTSLFHGGSSSGGPGGPGGSGGGSFLGDYTKGTLIQSGLQLAGSLLHKQVPQMQYAGVNAKGYGPGLGIHTVNGGFGLAVGGSEAAPSGVPDALRLDGQHQQAPGATAGDYNASALSNAASSSPQNTQPGNIGQTVANSVGVGGLVPQGAVNYMGNQ